MAPPDFASVEGDDDGFALVDADFHAGTDVPITKCQIVAPDFVTLALRFLPRMAADGDVGLLRLMLHVFDVTNSTSVRQVNPRCFDDWALCLGIFLAHYQASDTAPLDSLEPELQGRYSMLVSGMPDEMSDIGLDNVTVLGLHLLTRLLTMDFTVTPDARLRCSVAVVQLLKGVKEDSSAHLVHGQWQERGVRVFRSLSLSYCRSSKSTVSVMPPAHDGQSTAAAGDKRELRVGPLAILEAQGS